MERDKKGRERLGQGGEEKPGPADEYEALRAQLLAGLRRQPGDTRALVRIAGALSRMEAAEKGGSRRSRRDLGERVVAAMRGFEEQIALSGEPSPFLPEDWSPGPPTPPAASSE